MAAMKNHKGRALYIFQRSGHLVNLANGLRVDEKKYAGEKGAERQPLHYTAERYNERKIGHGAHSHSLPHPVIPVVF